MMHQDLTTWFGSQAQVDEPCIDGRPCLNDLSRFRRAPLKNPWMIQWVSIRLNYHGALHPMDDYPRTSLHFMDDYARTSHTCLSPSKNLQFNLINMGRGGLGLKSINLSPPAPWCGAKILPHPRPTTFTGWG